MFFDDRLATVLRQRGDSEVGQRTQYRQLLDILGNRKYGRDQSLLAAAWLRIEALSDEIPSGTRASMIRERGWRFRNPDLAAHLADGEPDVASAALNRAELSAQDWSALIPRLPVRARGFLRLRDDLPVDAGKLLDTLGVYDRGLPSPSAPELETPQQLSSQDNKDSAADASSEAQDAAPEIDVTPSIADPQPASPEPAGTEAERSEISALVERIAQFRRTREVSAAEAELSPRLPFAEARLAENRKARNFGFAADAAGRIEWAEQEIAAMVVGTRLVAPREMGATEPETALERAFARRQPLEGAAKTLSGAPFIAGDWIIDAQPRFSNDGGFSGYTGRFRRVPDANTDGLTPAQREADRIRQLLHELRTPVTAVQGYAEVIQQQLFGQAPHEYRALAAVIAADAAHILAGFEELDRLAKLETGASDVEQGETDIADMARQTTGQLGQVLAARMAGFEFVQAPDGPLVVSLDSDDAEALLWRFLATLAGACGTGEVLKANLKQRGGLIDLACDLPAQLAREEDIFAAEAKPIGSAINAGLFGAGFSLRLARAEAQSAGGNLLRDNETVTLSLPILRDDETLQSEA